MSKLVIRKFTIQKKRKKLKISIESIIWFFLILWTFEPSYFRENYIPWLHTVFKYGRFAASFTLCFIIFYHLIPAKDYKPSGFFLFIMVEEFILLLASILNPDATNIVSVLLDSVFLVLSFTAGLDYMFQKKPVKIIGHLLLISEILIYGNLITVILYPDGLYNVVIGSTRRYYLLGQQNQVILYILIGLVMSLLYSQYVKEKRFSLRTISLIAASIYMEIRFQSATGLVGLAVFVAIFLLTEFKHINIDLRWGIIASTVIFLIFIVFQKQDLFSTFLVNVLHRDVTASTRTTVWSNALMNIEKRPVLGYGIETIESSILRFGYITPHNRCLYMLYRGGSLLLISFIIMIVKCSQKLSNVKFERASVYLTGAIFALLLQMQFESYDSVIFYVLFIIAFHIEDVIKATKGRVRT